MKFVLTILRGNVPGVIPLVVSFDQNTSNPTAVVNGVIAEALAKIKGLGIATSGKAVVLHDADITDKAEMSDWAMRIVDI